jgi:uncharacterized membrane protein YphA (DoxX/SURF4 family)
MDRTKMEQQASGLAIGAVRIVAGTLWLANVNWKRPTDFGASNGSGLARWVDEGIKHGVFPPFTWALEHLVRPHLTPFGWFTLLAEALLGALLILGWRTRLVALAGAGMSIPIALTVLRAPNEWPWAYYLMVGVHLLLAASNAGEHFGLDGLRRRGENRTAWLALGVLGVVAGVAGVIAAASSPFTSKAGSLVGSRAFEVKLFWFNTLGALVCLLIGVLALAAWMLRRRELALAGSAFAALAALQVLLQWRGPGDTHGGILGATGGTLCLWLLLAIGLGVTASGRTTRST